ncbi:MAG TPA: M28 family peptidase [Solirubrobacteraceae bacterium]|nr:M28 family peptidase [Solirubrobacteraceae bacterium]
MLNARLYRAALVPFAFALAIAAFSLGPSPPGYTSPLAPDAFSGQTAFAELGQLAHEFPQRRPGESGDAALALRVADTIRGLGGTAGGGFSVDIRRLRADTIDGERPLVTVIAQRAGSTGEAPIVIMAHRDAAAGGAEAELSGTAALLELARVFASGETKRTIVLVSTTGGSAGDAGAANFAAHASGPFDAAIVLGDLAGARAHKPSVVPYSAGFGSAPLQLQRTVSGAITREAASAPGSPSVLGQLSHLAFPLTPGEQGPLDAAGIPAVLVQVSGERGPSAREPVSAQRLEGYGRGVLGAVYALDAAPDLPTAMQTGVLVHGQTIPEWAWRLLVGTLLLAPLAVTVDWWARARRRREALARPTLWALACALPFLLAAVFARALGLLGALPSAPAAPAVSTALPFDSLAARAVAATLLVLALAWALWPLAVRRLGLDVARGSDTPGLALMIVLVTLCVVVWALDPYAALLLVLGAHVALLIASPPLRPRPLGALGLIALALVPLLALVAFYAHELGLGPGAVAWTAVRLLAGGHVSIPVAALWSVAFGCAAAAAMLAFSPPAPEAGPRGPGTEMRITIRGPRSYAGPGSLGGTESALRR